MINYFDDDSVIFLGGTGRMKNYYKVWILLLMIGMMTGCKQEAPSLTVLIFSDLPTTLDENLSILMKEQLGEESTLSLELYPVYLEKISAELAIKRGDIFIVPEDDIINMMDPVSFTPLTEVAEELSLNSNLLENLKGMNPDTSETELYALPLGNDSYAISKLGVTSKQSLVAFVPNYSQKKEESIELIKYLISGEKTKGVEERNND